jgi:hypothetical protein
MNRQATQSIVERGLKRHGIEWATLKQSCKQIVLFGSSTLSVRPKPADIDLLCIGKGRRLKRYDLDLVWFSPSAVRKPSWLGSELANHVAYFGTWLHGKDDWTHEVYVSRKAITRKSGLIVARARALKRLWRSLRPEYQKKHAVKLRRDLQRLESLTAAAPIEPAPLLDRRWRRFCRTSADPRHAFLLRYCSLLPKRELKMIVELID